MSDVIVNGFCFKCQTAMVEGEKHACMTAEAAMAKSIELDNNAKPGDMYVDPVWGLVQVPYHDLDLGVTKPEDK